ncbi:histidine kinase [Myxococcota bacterium]|nr:histidine kinase [Myxococcota bacterium]
MDAGSPSRTPVEAPRAPAAPIDDRLLRAIGIPGFGLVIPPFTDLYGEHGPTDAVAWLGAAWFVLLAAIIWHTNRWLLFRTREHADWFDHPLRKIALLLFGVVFGTIPVTIGMLVAWFHVSAPAPDWRAIETVVLVNTISVVFVTHVYETVFLIKARADDRLATARLERARAEAELEAMTAQVDPHFLFNALNALGWLIREAPARAEEFTARLARLYRYILASRGRRLVLLAEELAFVDDYASLVALRFGEAVHVHLEGLPDDRDRFLVPPISVQVLVENAVKHNTATAEAPLVITLRFEDGALVVENERRPAPEATKRLGVGLANLAERVRLTTARELRVTEAPHRFEVALPVLAI